VRRIEGAVMVLDDGLRRPGLTGSPEHTESRRQPAHLVLQVRILWWVE
jgi:hypothetical protein